MSTTYPTTRLNLRLSIAKLSIYRNATTGFLEWFSHARKRFVKFDDYDLCVQEWMNEHPKETRTQEQTEALDYLIKTLCLEVA